MPGADFHFDLRILKNPYRDRSLRRLTGLDPRVQKDVFSSRLSHRTYAECLRKVQAALEKQDTVDVVFTCTGGKHRSVTFAERLAADLNGVEVRKNYPFVKQEN